MSTELNSDTFLKLVESVGKINTQYNSLNKNLDNKFEIVDQKLTGVTTSINSLETKSTDQTLHTDAAMIAGGAGTPGGLPQGSITIFRGRQGEDFNSWSELFELVFNAVGYDDAKKARLLPAYLRDNALQRFKALPAATKAEWGLLKQALKDALKPAEQARFARCKLADSSQKEDETVQDFSVRLEKLVKMAYPAFTVEQRSDILLAHFVSKLRLEIRGWVTAFEPKDYESAVSKAATIEANRRIDNGTYTQPKIAALSVGTVETDQYSNFDYNLAMGETNPHVYYNRTEEKPKFPYSGANANRDFRETETLKKDTDFLKEKMCELMIEVKRIGNQPAFSYRSRERYDNQGNQFTRSNQDRRDQKCFHCGKLGHFRSECRQRLAQIPNESPEYRRPPQIYVMEKSDKHDKHDDLSQENEQVKADNKCLRDQNKRLQERLWPAGQAIVRINALKASQFSDAFNKDVKHLFVQKADHGKDKKEPKRKSQVQFSQTHRFDKPSSCEYGNNNNASSKQTKDPKQRAFTGSDLLSVSIAIAVLVVLFGRNAHAEYTDRTPTYPAPMICSSSGSKAFWELPKPIPCGKPSHSDKDTVQAVSFEIYKHQLMQQRITGHACQITHQHSDTFVYFLEWDHWRQDSTKMETVSHTECQSMIQHKRCTHGPLVDESEYWITTNKHNADWGNWHFKCCQTHTIDTYNCALHDVIIYKRRNSPYMESGVGDVSSCKWIDQQFVQPDGTMLVWHPAAEYDYEYVTWQKKKIQCMQLPVVTLFHIRYLMIIKIFSRFLVKI